MNSPVRYNRYTQYIVRTFANEEKARLGLDWLGQATFNNRVDAENYRTRERFKFLETKFVVTITWL